jgi:ribosomal protein S18 acetylase RimI-like enzyme
MDNLEIRKFRMPDQSAVARLWQNAFPDDPYWNDPQDIIRRKFERHDDLFLVGLIKNKIVSVVLAGYDGFRGWVYHLAVDRKYRQQGIGLRMMKKVEESLLKMGCVKINLQVRSSNQDVIEFYKSIGYEIEDHISMGKLLSKNKNI